VGKKTSTRILTSIKSKPLVQRRHQQIFEAAIKLLSKKGYHTTTLREISKESRITLGNLYDYINTKDDILYIIQERATQAVMEAISKEKDENLNPVEKLRRLIDSELDAMNRYQDLILIIYQESHAMSKKILHSLLMSERRHVEQYEKLIRDGVKEGYLKPTNIRMMANMIKMLIDAWVVKRWDLRRKVSLDEMRQGILSLVFEGILRHG